MSDYMIDIDEALKDPDLNLVIDYVMSELEPERIAEVRKRLAEDEKFRDLAEPIIAAWTAKPKLVTPVIPPGQLERDWDEFTRRAGFVHQRARRRRRWGIGLLAMLAILVGATFSARYALRARQARLAEAEQAQYHVVPAGGRVVPLGEATAVKVAEGARIRVVPSKTLGAADTLRVLGAASVTVISDTLTSLASAGPQVTVKTLATVAQSASVLTIVAPSDTTPAAIYSTAMRSAARRASDSASGPAALRPSLVVIPGRPLGAEDTTTTMVEPMPGLPPKKGKWYLNKSLIIGVLLLVADIAAR